MWTYDLNKQQCTQWHEVYTLYWKGLVRGQLIGRTNAARIANALNAAAVDGSKVDA
jgi:hypothetical protein